MTKREQYQITFQKLPAGGFIRNIASSLNEDSYDIAAHLSYSDITNATDQLNDIDNTLIRHQRGLKVNNFWGEVFGSSLFIYPESDTVEIGHGGTIISLPDFKLLLQEWLTFIS
jgi:hypothetical protein